MSMSENENALHDQLERLFRRTLALSNQDSAENRDDSEDDPQDFKLTEDENDPDAHLATYLAASFVDEALSGRTSALNVLVEQAEDLLEPVCAWLEENDLDAFERITQVPHAIEGLLDGIFALVSLSKSSSKAKFAPGDRVMAILVQDGAWHEARVERVEEQDPSSSEGAPVTYHVRFIEYGAPQTVQDGDIAFDALWASSLDAEDDASCCRICQRSLPLTFHHLVPRETHSHVFRKAAKVLVPEIESLYMKRKEAYRVKSRKDWLEVHGINVCRKCHSQIHRVESNISLALKFNTLELILAHPDIVRWRAYASKLK